MSETNTLWKSPYIVLLLCTLIILISYGTRQSFGIFLVPISDSISGGRVEPFSFAVSLQTLIIGISVPFVSMIADKWLGPIKMLIIGGALYAFGMYQLSNAVSELHLALSIGVLSGLAASGCGLPMLLSVVGRVAPEKKRSLWLGIVSAGGTGGQMFLVPLNGFLLTRMDWTDAVIILASFIFAIVPMAIIVGKASGNALDQKKDTQTLGQALSEAREARSYWYLCLGFFTCGFQVQFIVTHLPKFLEDTGTGVTIGAHAIALIGFSNMIGTALAGKLGGHFRKKNLLVFLYVGRSLVMLAFFLAPISQTSVYIFASCIGVLWLATVPLTAGIISTLFGPRYMATLYAIAFLSHQIGGAFSTWMGGVVRDSTGSYEIWWWVIILGGALAALFHLPIKETPVERLAQTA
ncbi:MAG: MFS transporter [Rhodospirillaceae bacterium]|nr:MFS transporter [Rhodospirillaceae bacterium]|tara:strand:+ start:1922 stop:3145 length:1224 start_codon:yes stop_codon:yes gene_type:complete